MLRRKLSVLLSIGAAAVALTAGPAFAGVHYQLVNHDGAAGWNFKLGTGASGGFVNGPATPPFGQGSAHLAISLGNGDQHSSELRNKNYNDKPLSQLRGLSYWTYVHQNNGSQFPYLILDVSSTGGKSVDTLLFFEPPYQSPGTGGANCANQDATAMDTWQGWDAYDGCWYALDASTDAPVYAGPGTDSAPLSGYIAAHPKARIVNPSSGGAVRVLVGFADSAHAYDSNVDAFLIKFGDTANQYDFDPS
jgi:hypothetical protein